MNVHAGIDKNMRILIISDAWRPQINGVVRTYEDLVQVLEQDGHVIRVIGPADFPKRYPMPGYHEIELVLAPGKALRRMIAEFAPDTIHIATEGPLGWAMRGICIKNGWPFTTAFHTHFPDYAALRAAKYIPFAYKPVRALGIAMIRVFHGPSAAVLTTTDSVDVTLRSWGLRAPLYRLTRGVRGDVFFPGPKTLFRDLKQPVALYVGRVAIEKNIGAFLDMDWPGSKVVVGDGPSRTALEAQYPDVVFTGKKTGHDLADCFRSADIFAFPSRTDTFGIVLIEAMACGIPIAGYPVTGPMDIITDQRLGHVSQDLSAAAAQALAAPGTAEDRHAHLLQHYTWDVAARQFIEAQKTAIVTDSSPSSRRGPR